MHNVEDCHSSLALMFWRIDKIIVILLQKLIENFHVFCTVFNFIACLEYSFHMWLFDRTYVISLKDLTLNYCIIIQMVLFSKSPFFCFCSCLSFYFILLFHFHLIDLFIFNWSLTIFIFSKLFFKISKNGYINVYSHLSIFGIFFLYKADSFQQIYFIVLHVYKIFKYNSK